MKEYRERFSSSIDMGLLENPLIPRLSENAQWLLEQRYYLERYDPETGSCRRERSFEEFARRISRVIVSAETQYLDPDDVASLEWLRTLEKNLFSDILNRRFLFNSPCLFGSGAGMTVVPDMAERIYRTPDETTFEDYDRIYRSRTDSQQLFACFVIDVPDSIDGIFDSVRDAAVISKFGGGVGANFGNLRESGADIRGGTGGKASGPVSFMETWNTMGTVVVQGGRRRAALMGMLYDDHPDIGRFIDAKTEEGKLSYFNISVCVSDALIKAARTDGDFDLHSRVDGSITDTVRGRELWDNLCRSAWRRGDPGVFFIDRANVDNILKMDGEWKIESTNPCGEQPLPNYTSCNLGSINLEVFVHRDSSGEPVFDAESFADQTFRSMYYLDLVIDACRYPLERIEERTRRIRPVGLGLMGLADTAILLKLRYGSKPFENFCQKVSDVMASSALLATEELISQMNKPPFPESHLVAELFERFRQESGQEGLFGDHWFESLDESGLRRLIGRMRKGDLIPYTLVNTLEALLDVDSGVLGVERGKWIRRALRALVEGRMRNSRRLSIAPTGSISMLLDTSAGVEPNFAWSWTRRVVRSDDEGWENREYYHKLVSEDQKEEMERTGRISDERYVTAYDIGTEAHVAVTAIFAKVVDSGISKTVNLPGSATVEEVRRVYEVCYRAGCKGITIYRDGSREDQPIEVKKAESQLDEPQQVAIEHTSQVKDRPGLVVFGKTVKDKTPWGSLYVTLNFDGEEPFEVFASIGKSGSEMNAMTEALSRVISIGLRSGGKLEDFIATLRGISGKEYWLFDCDDQSVVRSIPDAVALLLEKLTAHESVPSREGRRICPECGAPMEFVAGCAYCFSCGYSPCK